MSISEQIGWSGANEMPAVHRFFAAVDRHAADRGLEIEIKFGINQLGQLAEDADYLMFPAFDPALSTGDASRSFWIIVKQDGEITHHGTEMLIAMPGQVTLLDYLHEAGMWDSDRDSIELTGEAAAITGRITERGSPAKRRWPRPSAMHSHESNACLDA